MPIITGKEVVGRLLLTAISSGTGFAMDRGLLEIFGSGKAGSDEDAKAVRNALDQLRNDMRGVRDLVAAVAKDSHHQIEALSHKVGVVKDQIVEIFKEDLLNEPRSMIEARFERLAGFADEAHLGEPTEDRVRVFFRDVESTMDIAKSVNMIGRVLCVQGMEPKSLLNAWTNSLINHLGSSASPEDLYAAAELLRAEFRSWLCVLAQGISIEVEARHADAVHDAACAEGRHYAQRIVDDHVVPAVELYVQCVERLVLSQTSVSVGYPGSPYSIPESAGRIFLRADLFAALTLGQDPGVRGRVFTQQRHVNLDKMTGPNIVIEEVASGAGTVVPVPTNLRDSWIRCVEVSRANGVLTINPVDQSLLQVVRYAFFPSSDVMLYSPGAGIVWPNDRISGQWMAGRLTCTYHDPTTLDPVGGVDQGGVLYGSFFATAHLASDLIDLLRWTRTEEPNQTPPDFDRNLTVTIAGSLPTAETPVANPLSFGLEARRTHAPGCNGDVVYRCAALSEMIDVRGTSRAAIEFRLHFDWHLSASPRWESPNRSTNVGTIDANQYGWVVEPGYGGIGLVTNFHDPEPFESWIGERSRSTTTTLPVGPEGRKLGLELSSRIKVYEKSQFLHYPGQNRPTPDDAPFDLAARSTFTIRAIRLVWSPDSPSTDG